MPRALALVSVVSVALTVLTSAPAPAGGSSFPTYGTPLQKFIWVRNNLVRFCNIVPGPHMTFGRLPTEIKLELAVANESRVVQRLMDNCSYIEAMNTAE